MPRHSGLQKDVLKMYRSSLRMIQSKQPEYRSNWFQFVAHQFRSAELGGGVKKRDTATIEYLLRRGRKMLDTYSGAGVKDIHVPPSDQRWEEGWIAKGGKERLRSG